MQAFFPHAHLVLWAEANSSSELDRAVYMNCSQYTVQLLFFNRLIFFSFNKATTQLQHIIRCNLFIYNALILF